MLLATGQAESGFYIRVSLQGSECEKGFRMIVMTMTTTVMTAMQVT